MNEVTSLGISGTTITIANNEEGRRQEEEGRVSLISQLFMVGSKERERGRRKDVYDGMRQNRSPDLI